MVDTVRTTAFLLANEFQDGQNKTLSAQFIRDFVVSVMPPEVTLTFSPTVSWNMDTTPVARIVVVGGCTITASGGVAGQSYRINVIQDGTGNRSIILSGVTLQGAAAFAQTANANNFVNVEVTGSPITRFATIS